MRRHHRLAAATMALALVAGACGSGSDEADTEDVDTDVAVDATDDAVEEEDPEETEPIEDEVDDVEEAEATPDVSEMTDEEFAAFLNGLTDEEFEEFTADYSDEEYDELRAFIEAVSNGPDNGGDDISDDEDTVEEEPAAEEESAGEETAGPPATRDDVDCSAEGLGADDTFAFTTAHVVVEGQLGALCFGEPDQRVVDAWDSLATIAPAGQLADLGLFGGFQATEEGEETTLAFVNPLDDDGTLFQMSLNLQSYDDDPAEAQLTMAHEFAHVFTLLPSQVDRTSEAIDNCGTYFNGEGCYLETSLMWQWISEFWGDGLIDQVDPTGEATAEVGQARCDADAGFFGAYGASTPEEDFAEAFSAYVFDIETFSAEQDERISWIAAQPGLAEFRERAVAAGVPTPPNNFDQCGLG